MIYLIITASIHNYEGVVNEEHRKKTYLESIHKTLSILPDSIKPIIVENNGPRSTYLDDLPCDINYTNNNNEYNVVNLHNKGINELNDLHYIIHKYSINDEDLIIKLTGRYHPKDDHFFKEIMNHPEFEVYIKFFNVCTQTFMDLDCVLGMYAIRCKYLKEFSYQNPNVSPEVEFATYIRNKIPLSNIYPVDQLHLRCCFADDLRILDV